MARGGGSADFQEACVSYTAQSFDSKPKRNSGAWICRRIHGLQVKRLPMDSIRGASGTQSSRTGSWRVCRHAPNQTKSASMPVRRGFTGQMPVETSGPSKRVTKVSMNSVPGSISQAILMSHKRGRGDEVTVDESFL